MIININNKFRVSVEADHYVVEEPKTSKGVKNWVGVRWFTNLERLIKFLVHSNLKSIDKEVTLDQFLREYKEQVKEIKTLVGNL